MKKPDLHFLVCNSFRVIGDAQGYCNKKGATDMVQYLIDECNDRGLDAVVSTTACLNVCSQGPIMVVHPLNDWYGGMTPDRIDEILDAIEEGGKVDSYLISD